MSAFGTTPPVPNGIGKVFDKRRDKNPRNRKKPFKPSNDRKNPNEKRPKSRKKFEKPNNDNQQLEAIDSDFEDDLPQAKVIPKLNVNFQNYGKNEIQQTGVLIDNPESLGFKPKSLESRELPKYLQIQPRIIVPIPFKQDEWDLQNQKVMNEMESANGNDYQGIYEEFQKMREIERKKMEELGLVDAENIRKDLNDAISFQGTCLDMCPTFERVRRALENNVKKLEKDPVTNKITKSRAVKAFSRPAAGQPPPLPSEVRPPFILKSTLDYLVDEIVPQLPDSHSFIWDRTRSIRQDFTYQNYYGPEAIDCNERIVRIHLICLHIMAGNDVEYSQQQELEQFNKALQTLMEIYQDVRNRGGKCPNEPEFRAYYLISHLRESEIEREIQQLPNYIVDDPQVQLALKFRKLSSQNNIVERGFKNSVGSLNLFVEFFRLVFKDETPFLMSCLLETLFNEIRFYAIKSMTRGYHTKGKAYDGETLRAMLGFDNIDQLVKFVEYYEIDVINDHGVILIDLVNKEKLETKYKINALSQKPRLSQAFSKQLDKKITSSLSTFINSGKSNDDLSLKNANDIKILESNRKIVADKPVKAGSLADFLSKPSQGFTQPLGFTQSLGFSQPPVLLDFNKAEPTGPAAVHVPLPTDKQTNGFSFTANKPEKPEPKKVAFNFSSTPATTPASSTGQLAPSSAPDTKTSVPASRPPASVGAPLAPSKTETLVPKLPTFLTPLATVSLAPKLPVPHAPLFLAPQAPSIPVSKAPEMPVARNSAIPLKSQPKFESALNSITQNIIMDTISEELQRNVSKLIKHHNQQQERSRVIEVFSKELYDAFLNEVIFKLALETKAQEYYNKKIKIKQIKKIKQVGRTMKIKQELKQKRQNELNSVTFNKPLKRLLSNSSFNSVKRRHVWNETSIAEIVDKRNEIEKLWQPINFKKFIDTLSANFKVSIEVPLIDLRVLILVENFKLNYSKWLINKLNLQVNAKEMIYENNVHNDKINLHIQTLPTKEQLNKEFFKNTSFIVFECGLLEPSDKFTNIKDKLRRDGMILKKITELTSKYSNYKVQILIIYWDITNSHLSQVDIEEQLAIKLENNVFCNMSESNINEILNDGFDKLSNNFTGELSKKGKMDKPIKEFKTPVKEIIRNDKFKLNETTLLNKAKLDRKYGYLNNHSLANQLILNQLYRNQLYRQNQLMVNLFRNQLINTSNILRDEDITNISVGPFGQEIIQESTPFGTPFGTPLGTPKKTAAKVPKNLQLLIDLTAKVKSKYK